MSTTMISSTSFSLKIFTALTGSPTYFGLPKLTVLTRPPFLINRQGVIRGRNMLTSPQNSSIVGYPTDGFFPGEIVRMQEVKPARRSDILEQAFPASGFDVVPSHMRQVRAPGRRRTVEFFDFGIKPPKSFQQTLVASFGNH